MKKKRRSFLKAVLIIFGIIVLLCVLVLAYGAFIGFTYDDTAALAAENTEPYDLISTSEDCSVRLLYDKSDLYSVIEDSDMISDIRDSLSSVGGKLIAYSFDIDGSEVSVRFKAVFAHVVAVQGKVIADIEYKGTLLSLKPKCFYLGRLISVSPEKISSLAKISELKEGIEFDISDIVSALSISSIEFGDSSILVDTSFPAKFQEESADQFSSMLNKLSLYCGEDMPSAALAAKECSFGEYMCSGLESGSSLPQLIADYICLYDVGAESALKNKLADYYGLVGIKPDMADKAIEEYNMIFADGQRELEGILFELREEYKAGHLAIGKRGFNVVETGEQLDIGTLTENSFVKDCDSRAVFQYSYHSTRPVRTYDMPLIKNIPLAPGGSLPSVGQSLYDLALVIRMRSGIPILVYWLGEGPLVINGLSEKAFNSYMSASAIPVLCSDNTPTPARWVLDPAPALGLSDVYYLFP